MERSLVLDVISSRKNDYVRFIRSFLHVKHMRDEHGIFAVEGDHLCSELVKTQLKVTFAAYTEKAAEKYRDTVSALLERADACINITEELSEYISDTQAPQGVFALAEMPSVTVPENACKIIVLDGVQDPGNVGTIVRTAEALGMDGAVLCNNCADVFSPKTLRASMGSILRFPCVKARCSELRSLLEGFSIYGAMLDRNALNLEEAVFPKKTAVVIGNEGGGISKEVRALCDETVYIPIQNAESLNASAAAAILMWQLRTCPHGSKNA